MSVTSFWPYIASLQKPTRGSVQWKGDFMDKPVYQKPVVRELPLQGAFTIGTYWRQDGSSTEKRTYGIR